MDMPLYLLVVKYQTFKAPMRIILFLYVLKEKKRGRNTDDYH